MPPENLKFLTFFTTFIVQNHFTKSKYSQYTTLPIVPSPGRNESISFLIITVHLFASYCIWSKYKKNPNPLFGIKSSDFAYLVDQMSSILEF